MCGPTNTIQEGSESVQPQLCRDSHPRSTSLGWAAEGACAVQAENKTQGIVEWFRLEEPSGDHLGQAPAQGNYK